MTEAAPLVATSFDNNLFSLKISFAHFLIGNDAVNYLVPLTICTSEGRGGGRLHHDSTTNKGVPVEPI